MIPYINEDGYPTIKKRSGQPSNKRPFSSSRRQNFGLVFRKENVNDYFNLYNGYLQCSGSLLKLCVLVKSM